ncbi:MAG: sialidase family protein [Ghiorsea sp.]
MKTTLFLLVWVIAALLTWQHVQQAPAWSPIIWQETTAQKTQALPLFEERLIPNAGQHSTHSVSSTVLPSGDLVSFWFAGSREGGKDVQIYQSYFRKNQQLWTEPLGILNVEALGEDLGRYIGKIGNPLVFVDSRQRMWLFFVSVSYGGWAGSSLNHVFSDDLGKSWSQPKRLITSPFINVSTLVRNTMFELADGSLALPVYHEFLAQFPELLRVSKDGEVISKTRIAGFGGGIQPSLVQGNNHETYAFMRTGSHTNQQHVLRLFSKDDGETWSDVSETNLPNPNSAQVVARIAPNQWLWVGNHNVNDRHDLSLAITNDLSGSWQMIYRLEQDKKKAFSYPDIVQDEDGFWHVLYTYNRKNIKHVRFNKAWLDNLIVNQGGQS